MVTTVAVTITVEDITTRSIAAIMDTVIIVAVGADAISGMSTSEDSLSRNLMPTRLRTDPSRSSAQPPDMVGNLLGGWAGERDGTGQNPARSV
jgi:hypothetical protein